MPTAQWPLTPPGAQPVLPEAGGEQHPSLNAQALRARNLTTAEDLTAAALQAECLELLPRRLSPELSPARSAC